MPPKDYSEQILTYLRSLTEPQRVMDVCEGVGLSYPTVKRYLDDALKIGNVKMVPIPPGEPGSGKRSGIGYIGVNIEETKLPLRNQFLPFKAVANTLVLSGIATTLGGAEIAVDDNVIPEPAAQSIIANIKSSADVKLVQALTPVANVANERAAFEDLFPSGTRALLADAIRIKEQELVTLKALYNYAPMWDRREVVKLWPMSSTGLEIINRGMNAINKP